jgi:hypothetical protein
VCARIVTSTTVYCTFCKVVHHTVYCISYSSTMIVHHTTHRERKQFFSLLLALVLHQHHKIQKIQCNTFKRIQDVMSNHFDFLIAMSLTPLILTVVTTNRTQISLSHIKHLGTIEIMAMRNRTAHLLKPQESPDAI